MSTEGNVTGLNERIRLSAFRHQVFLVGMNLVDMSRFSTEEGPLVSFGQSIVTQIALPRISFFKRDTNRGFFNCQMTRWRLFHPQPFPFDLSRLWDANSVLVYLSCFNCLGQFIVEISG